VLRLGYTGSVSYWISILFGLSLLDALDNFSGQGS